VSLPFWRVARHWGCESTVGQSTDARKLAAPARKLRLPPVTSAGSSNRSVAGASAAVLVVAIRTEVR
jgi:hypothetical protein